MADGINDNAGTDAGGTPTDAPMDAAAALEAEVNDLDISPFSDPEPEPAPEPEPQQPEGEGEKDLPPEGEPEEGEGDPGTQDPEGPPTEGEVPAEPAAPAEGDEPSQIEKLLAQINDLQGQLNQQNASQPPAPAEAPPAQEPPATPPDPSAAPADIDFVGQIDMDDVASDPAVFNKVLNDVVQKTQLQAAEQVLLAIPHVIAAQVQQQSGINKTINDFYADNPDLRNVSKVVQATAQQIALEKPESDMTSLLKDAAAKTREVLGLTAPVISGSDSISPPGASQSGLPTPPGGSTRSKPQISSLQAEIDEL